jgi:hypothetical protein
MNSTQSLAERLTERLWTACEHSREVGCFQNNFEQLLRRHDVVTAVRHLIMSPDLVGNLKELAHCGRLDLAPEFIMQEPEYRQLFNDAELTAAKHRLKALL